MKMKSFIFLIMGLLILPSLKSQNNGVAINETGEEADNSAILDIKSQNQGVLIPRISTSERKLIQNPAQGLIIYNKTRFCLEFYTGNSWTSATPAGTVISFAGESGDIPDGWLLCDGQSVSKTDYEDLFNAIGEYWGSGSGGSTFSLPDLRGYFLRGATLSSSP